MASTTKNYDPGTGARFKQRTKRIINKDGSFNVRKEGARFKINDAYLVFIKMKWWQFFATLITGFIAINLVFAAIYVAIGVEQLGLQSESMLESFIQSWYFSAQTFTTVGYGAISPVAHTASVVAAFEALAGFLSFALATGLLFGRFSRPNARIRFSNNLLIHEVGGVRSLLFRIVNERPNHLMRLMATVMLVLSSQEPNGGINRDYHRLKLEVDMIEFFPLSWTIVHPINEESPLFAMSDEEIMHSNGELLIHMHGFDEMFSQDVHQRFSYMLSEAKTGRKFSRPFETEPDGEVVLYLDRLDQLEAS